MHREEGEGIIRPAATFLREEGKAQALFREEGLYEEAVTYARPYPLSPIPYPLYLC